MTTAYTSLLGLALPVTGELQGTWGDTVNNSITSLLDTAISGTTTLSTDADVTLTTTTGAANQARQAILLCSGARTAQRTITAPAQSKIYTVINNTSGGYAVKLVGVGPTTGVTIPAGTTAQVAWNGSDFVDVSGYVNGNLTVNGSLTVKGNTTLGDAAADTVTVNGTITSNLIFTDNTYDIGASGANRPRAMYLSAGLTVGSSLFMQNNQSFLIRDSASNYKTFAFLSTTDNAYVGLYQAPATSNTNTYVYAGGTLGITVNATGGDVTLARYVSVNGAGIDSSYPLSVAGSIKTIGDNKGIRVLNSAGTSAGNFVANTGTGTGATLSTDAGPLVLYTSSRNSVNLSGSSMYFYNDTVPFFVTGNAYGGAIRFSANSASATDRYLSFGFINNSNTYTGIMTVSDGSSTTYPVTITRGDSSSGATVWPQYIQMSTAGAANFGNGAGTFWAAFTNVSAQPVAGFSGYLIDGGTTSTNYGGGAAIWIKNPSNSSPTRTFYFDQYGNIGGSGVTPPASSSRGFFPGTYGWFGDNSNDGGTNAQMAANAYYASPNWVRRNSGYATLFQGVASDGAHYWYSGPTGSGSSNFSFTQTGTLDRSGNLTIAGSFYPSTSNTSTVDISGNSAGTWYTVTSPGALTQGYYIVFYRWDHTGSGQPYIVAGGFQLNVVNTNGGGTDNIITPLTSTHTGSGYYISFRTIAGTSSTTGVQYNCTFSGTGPLTIKYYKIY